MPPLFYLLYICFNPYSNGLVAATEIIINIAKLHEDCFNPYSNGLVAATPKDEGKPPEDKPFQSLF